MDEDDVKFQESIGGFFVLWASAKSKTNDYRNRYY